MTATKHNYDKLVSNLATLGDVGVTRDLWVLLGTIRKMTDNDSLELFDRVAKGKERVHAMDIEDYMDELEQSSEVIETMVQSDAVENS